MSLKLCFKDKIHRISQAPLDFKSLTATIIATYPNQLPPSWELYYIDSEGDKISLSHDQDYKDFLGSNPNNPSMSLKVYIVPADGEPLNPIVAPLHVSQKPQFQQEEQKIEEIPQKADENQEHYDDEEEKDDGSREKSSEEDISDEISQQSDDIRQQTDSNRDSQNQREKAAKADSREERRPKREAKPRADPQPGNGGANSRVLNQGMDLLKKITRGDMSDAELMQALEKLAKLEESMTPEQKEELNKKKEDIERRRARRESRLAGTCQKDNEECKGEDMKESKCRRHSKREEKLEGMMKSNRIGNGEKPERPKKEGGRNGKERRPRRSNVSKALDKILAVVEKGDAKRVSKCRDQVLEKLSEEEKKALAPVFEMLAKGTDADSLRKVMEDVKGKMLDDSGLQDDGKIEEELDESEIKEEIN